MVFIPKITGPEHTKEVPLEIIETNDKTGYVKSYGSVFGVADEVGEIVDPGAFKKAIERRKIKRVWQHDHKRPVGKLISIAEDAKGLILETEYNLNTSWGKDAYHAVKHGDVDSFSIGYNEIKAKNYVDDNGIKHLGEVDLREVSDVTFPANEYATAVEIKGLDMTEDDIIEFSFTINKKALDEKAGRTISRATRAQITAARDFLNTLLGEAEDTPDKQELPAYTEAVESRIKALAGTFDN